MSKNIIYNNRKLVMIIQYHIQVYMTQNLTPKFGLKLLNSSLYCFSVYGYYRNNTSKHTTFIT